MPGELFPEMEGRVSPPLPLGQRRGSLTADLCADEGTFAALRGIVNGDAGKTRRRQISNFFDNCDGAIVGQSIFTLGGLRETEFSILCAYSYCRVLYQRILRN
jgi:hypothetical protein